MDWTRGHTIGRGSSATVSTATSARSGDTLAVKSAELENSQFLQREQKILSNLSSPHIVSYKGCDITRENNKLMYNILMEYIPGGTLTDAIHRHSGSLDESVIGYYTWQLVQGLEYLHSSGIVHCDIKGSNILIGDHGAKIADFGCARWVSPEAGDGDVAVPIGGTPVYMAPEVARGEEQGPTSDIWSLGCTIIEMATGGSPWPNMNNPLSALYRIAFSGEIPEIPNFLSDQTKDFLRKCLRREPKERWTAKELLKHPFLGEFNSDEKNSQNFDSNSPTCILDQGFWKSMEESESDMALTSSLISPIRSRIGRLSLSSGVANWTCDESCWVTIRSISNGNELVDENTVCGSMTALNIYNMELEGNVIVIEDLVDFSDRKNVSCSDNHKSNNSLMACTCTEHGVIYSGLNFRKEREKLQLVQSQFF